MFRDESQKAAICRTLLARAGIEHLWTLEGPARTVDPSSDVLRSHPDGLRLYLLCWALWDETGILAFSDLFQLEAGTLRAVGELLQALARCPAAIDAWLKTYSDAEPVR